MKRLLMLSFFAFPGLCASEPIDEALYQKLKNIAHPKAFAKLEKALTLDPDDYYQKKCVAHGQLLRDKIEKQLGQKIKEVEQKYIKELPFWGSFEINRFGASFDLSGEIRISQPADESALEMKKYVEEFTKCYDIPASIFLRPKSLNSKAYMTAITERNKGKYSIFIDYDSQQFKTLQKLKVAQFAVVHELTHIKFEDGLYYINVIETLPKKIAEEFRNRTVYYAELRADNYPAAHSIEIAKQGESFMINYLRNSLFFLPLFVLANSKDDDIKHVARYNHPTKGTSTDDSHPSFLLRYAKLMKTRKVLEAEKRWFNTAEADKRYGNAYYEIAFAKAHEDKEKMKLK